MEYNDLKKAALEKFFERSNEQQKKAIFRTNGAVLIIAGAGSGKTTVLCNRIANLLLFGDAYNSDYVPQYSDDDLQFLQFFSEGKYDGMPEAVKHLSEITAHNKAIPWKILAVTFTNKAASELKERLSRMNVDASDVWAATFHSTCVKILRRSIEAVGYNKNFVIYDTDDSKRVIKSVLDAMGISEKTFNPKVIMSAISRAKDKLITPKNFPVVNSEGKADFQLGVIRDVYEEYQRRLKAANALDFDDIIMKTVEVFTTDSEALHYWQSHFDYVMVDEYQDTNMAQYELVKLLSGGRGNLCVVGDEDQSIYRFRGATIENILSFESEFDSAVIKLEQNYRSTCNILDAANSVIRNNTQHKDKNLWSDLGEGDKIQVYRFSDDQSEAMFVANEILALRKNGGNFADTAILYRNNAQSRSFEMVLGKSAVPYRIVGGTKFYDRKEIKDAIAYLSVICNPYDTVRLGRIINEPKRGIGAATWGEIERISLSLGISPIECMEQCQNFPTLSKKAKTLLPVAAFFRDIINTAEEREVTDIFEDIMEQSGYMADLKAQGDEGIARIENLSELKSSMMTFCEENESHSLFDYLEQVALISDLDSYDMGEDCVTLMTMHAAKGLEFENVFIVSAEEGIFPSYQSLGDVYEMEENRRLCYVAITRAKRRLFITTAESRILYGQVQHNKMSRFIREIPPDYMEFNDKTRTTPFGFEKTAKRTDSGYLQSRAIQKEKDSEQPMESFSAGDRITHSVFGDGTVFSAAPIGNDTLLEISFDKVGTKKIMAKFAKIKKI